MLVPLQNNAKGEKISARECVRVKTHSVDLKCCRTKGRNIPEVLGGGGKEKIGCSVLLT